MALLFC